MKFSFKKLWTLKSAALSRFSYFWGSKQGTRHIFIIAETYMTKTPSTDKPVLQRRMFCCVLFLLSSLKCEIAKQRWNSVFISHTHIKTSTYQWNVEGNPLNQNANRSSIIALTNNLSYLSLSSRRRAAPQDKVSVRWNEGSRYPTNSNTILFYTPILVELQYHYSGCYWPEQWLITTDGHTWGH